MKLLMVAQQMGIGGAETHIINLCHQLVLRGHSITVVSAGGLLVPQLTKDHIEHITLPLNKKNPLATIKNYCGLRRILLTRRYDIVHSHARIPGFILGKLAKKIDFRWVSTCHGILTESRVTPLLSFWGDAVLAVSDDVKQYLKNTYRFSADRIYPVINGIDSELFVPSSTTGSGHRLISVSRLSSLTVTPVLSLCRSMPEICSHFPDTTLTIVGDGNAFTKVQKVAATINRQLHRNAIRLTGSLSSVQSILPKADVFVGVSRAAYEAMSCGLPVILSGAQGYGGIITEHNRMNELATNYCSRGTKTAEESQLASAVISLFSKPGWAQRLGRENRAFIKEHLSSEQMADMYEDFYMNLPLRLHYPTPDIVLSGYFGYQNAGDDETIRSFLMEVSQTAPNLRILVLANRQKEASVFYQVRCLNRYRIFAVYKQLFKSKLFVACGGSLLQDATSMRSLLYYASLFRLAEWAGCKLAIYAAGIGPLNRPSSRSIVARIAENVDHLSLRDEGSARLIREICCPNIRFSVTADTVFLMPPVGMGPSGEFGISLHYSKIDFPDYRKFQKFADKLGKAVEELRTRTGLTPIVLVMHPNADNEISQAFADQHHLTICRGGEVLPAAHRCAFVISMRLHTLLFAVTEGHPAFGISSDPKVQNLLFPFSLPTILPKDFDPDAFVPLVYHSMKETRYSGEKLTAVANKQRQKAQNDFYTLLQLLE